MNARRIRAFTARAMTWSTDIRVYVILAGLERTAKQVSYMLLLSKLQLCSAYILFLWAYEASVAFMDATDTIIPVD